MKILFFILIYLISFANFAQDHHIVTTKEGKKVLLNPDFTWKYIETDSTATNVVNETILETQNLNNCNISEGFEEPNLDAKIQMQLKKGRATIQHVKKKVAKDYNCKIEDVFLLSVNEQKSKAVYIFCVHGEKTKYKRIGHSIIKNSIF